jgi:hypothetical protein
MQQLPNITTAASVQLYYVQIFLSKLNDKERKMTFNWGTVDILLWHSERLL